MEAVVNGQNLVSVKMIQKIKCFFGFHDWAYARMPVTMKEFRKCRECPAKQHLAEIVIKDWE